MKYTSKEIKRIIIEIASKYGISNVVLLLLLEPIERQEKELREIFDDLINDVDCVLSEEDFTFQSFAGFRTKLQESKKEVLGDATE